MTVESICGLVDIKEPNSYSTDEKVAWLSNLDGKIFEEVIKKYAEYDPDEDTFTPYTSSTYSTDTLLIDAPYGEDIYVHYLIAMIAQGNGETSRYNQQIALYNTAYSQWWNHYNTTHHPVCMPRFYF